MKGKIFFSILLTILSFAFVYAEEAVKLPVKGRASSKTEGKVYAGMRVDSRISRKVLKKITAKYSKMYRKYAGIKSTRHVSIKWYKPESMKLVKTEKAVYIRWDAWYKDLKIKTVSYTVNGEKQDPEDYDPHESSPGIPHFDKNGFKEYFLRVVGVEKLRGKLAYKIKATPRKPKGEHFKGFIWVSVNDLEIMKNKGTSGDLRFGCSDLYVSYDAKDIGDYFHFTRGYTKVTLNVLGIYKRILVFEFVNKDIKPMSLPKKK